MVLVMFLKGLAAILCYDTRLNALHLRKQVLLSRLIYLLFRHKYGIFCPHILENHFLIATRPPAPEDLKMMIDPLQSSSKKGQKMVRSEGEKFKFLKKLTSVQSKDKIFSAE